MGDLPWKEKVAEKCAQCAAGIPNEWKVPASVLGQLKTPWEASKNNLIEMGIVRQSGILTEKELEITEKYTVAQLLKALAAGDLSSVDVTVAFSKRAAIAQQLTCCLTETFFDEALERARHLDDLKSRGQLAGPLHGLPISLKDTFFVKGKQSTLGLIAYLDHKADQNAPLVDILLSLGAVLYVKTNVPQTMMSIDSHNHVFGRVLNPHNTTLTAGGSTGGEGALIAFRGSPLGVGTDIAGSIRLPALCCGIYGFRPTANRIPFSGQQACFTPGLVPILATAGPMAGDMESLGTFMRAVIDARPALLDSTAFDIPWRSPTVPKTKLRLGLLPEDPVFPLQPPVRAALDEAARKLKAEGHEIVQLEVEKCQVSYAAEVASHYFALDDGCQKLLMQGGEPPVPSLVVTAQIVHGIRGKAVSDIQELDKIDKLVALNVKRQQIADSWQKIWLEKKLDGVIAPGAQNTAVEHDQFGIPPYTVFLNLLDFPACIIPFNKAKKNTQTYDLKEGQVGPKYNPENLEGAPCCIQVFTNRMRDEECLGVSTIIDQCLQSQGQTAVTHNLTSRI